MIVFRPHSQKQQDAIFSDTKITTLLTGVQFGKTTAGSLWMKRMMCKHTAKDDNFVITAPSYKIMHQSTLPAFIKYMDGFAEYRKGDAMFELHHGGTCYLRTATEPDSIVGITNVRAIWGDEAGKYSLYFWENIQGRASFKNCPIMLTTTPYASNWLFKEIVKGAKSGNRTDINLIQASSDENPYFPKEEFERRRQHMDARRFAALYLGQFEKMHGLVYDCFDEDSHVIDPCQLPTGTRFYAGIDWGHTQPFALVVRAVTPGGYHFQVSEHYQTGLTLPDMVIVAKQKKQVFDIQTFFAGPDQPGNIEEFNRNGLPCVKADNRVRVGVDFHYELIKSNRYKVFKGTSPYTLDEMASYRYPEPEEVGVNEDATEENPVKQDDHAMDANRYCTIMTYRTGEKREPKNPREESKRPQDQDRRILWLKNGAAKNKGSENWS